MKVSFLNLFYMTVIVCASVVSVSACTCSAYQTVLDEFNRSPIVIKARLDRMDELERSVAGSNVYRTMAAVLSVETSYKGTLKAGQSIKVLDGGDGSGCAKPFVREKLGQEFVFYLTGPRQIGNLKGRMYSVDLCSRSSRLDDATPDLAFLDNRMRLMGKTRIYGSVKRFGPEPASLANIKVTITGKNFDRLVETDARGFFELWDLPPGQYRVAFATPSGVAITAYKTSPDRAWRRESLPENTVTATVAPRKHLELTIGLDSRRGAGN